MARTVQYICTRHGGEVPRELLLAKKVQFVGMGEGSRTHRSRVVEWLCPQCIAKDEDWNRPRSFSAFKLAVTRGFFRDRTP